MPGALGLTEQRASAACLRFQAELLVSGACSVLHP